MDQTQTVKKVARHAILKSERALWESLWQDLAEYLLPRKDDIQTTQTAGMNRYTGLLDSAGQTNLELLAGFLHGMLTNPVGYFFNLGTGKLEVDQRDSVRRWIQSTVRTLHDKINNANFQTEVYELYLDLCAFGTGCLTVEFDDRNRLKFTARPLKEIFISEDAFGRVNEVHRAFKLDGYGLMQMFGEENIPSKTLKEIQSGKYTGVKYEVLHIVMPRDPSGNKTRDSKLAFTSEYILVCEKHTLKIGGFKDFPYLVPRWSKASGETWGRGPGERALAPTRVINEMKKTTIRGAQKSVDPPLMAPDDGFVLPLNTKPGGLNYYRSGAPQYDRIAPIFNDARVDFGYQVMDAEKVSIREAFYVDQLKLREGPQMTATEVAERAEQALRFLGPMLGRMQTEFLEPLVERVYYMLLQQGEIEQPPAEIADVELKIQFSSVAAMSQRMSEVQNINRAMAAITPFASFDPSVMDIFDGTATAKYLAKLFNYPQEGIRNQDQIDKIRKDRAEQQQAQQQALMAESQSKQVANTAGAVQKLSG